MPRSLWIAIALIALLLAYLVWPLVGFYRVAEAIKAKDTAALGEVLDLPALRKSFTKQLTSAYLEMTGEKREKDKKPKLTMIEKTVAVGIGTSIAEPIVAQLINEKTLLNLLTKGRFKLKLEKGGGGREGVRELSTFAPFREGKAPSLWQAWTSLDYRGTDVFAYLPPGKPREEQFRARFNLSGWQWKLAGLELPEPMLTQLVKELIAQRKMRELTEGE